MNQDLGVRQESGVTLVAIGGFLLCNKTEDCISRVEGTVFQLIPCIIVESPCWGGYLFENYIL